MGRRSRGLVAGVLSLGVSAAGFAAAPARADETTEPVPSFRVMTLNIRQDLSATNWAADAQRASSLTDILAMQEGNRTANRTAMLDMMHAQGWEVWVPETGGTELPVAWNASMFTLVSGQTLLVHKGEPKVTPARFINTVVLQDLRTGEDVAVVNTHTINHGAVDAGLQPNDRTPRLKKHIAMLHDQILAAQQLTPNVVSTGDLNVNHMRDRNLQIAGLPTNVLGPIVDFDMPIGRTYDHGNTELDYVMTPIGANLAPVSAEIVGGFKSDHSGVVDGMAYVDRTGPITRPANIPETPPPPPAPVTPTPEPEPYSTLTFRPATVHNATRGTAARRVLDAAVKVIDNAPPGGSIHLVTQTLGDGAVRRALVRAVKRDVHLQVFLRGARLNRTEIRLRDELGLDLSQRDWFHVGCSNAACRKVDAKMAATTLLASQSGRTPAIRLVLNRALDKTARDRRAHATTTTDKRRYDRAFHNFFRMVR